MFASLVWMFQEHRDLYLECERLRRVTDDLERQLAMKVDITPAVTGDFLKNYVDTVLKEDAFPDNKIPDSFWLTPGENERERA